MIKEMTPVQEYMNLMDESLKDYLTVDQEAILSDKMDALWMDFTIKEKQFIADKYGLRGPDGFASEEPKPIPMILHCPFCSRQHLDLDEWATKPHKTHLCANCDRTWRPANVHTVGVQSLEEESK